MSDKKLNRKKCFRNYNFRIDSLNDELGVFTGYACVFGELAPTYKEIADPGSFTQTLRHNGGKVPITLEHWAWIGMGQHAEEDKKGLFVEGKLEIEHTPDARSAWGLMKLSQEVNRPAGLSIGFRGISEETIDGVIHLKEVALIEYGITPPGFAAYSSAEVTSVRGRSAFKSFLRECLTEMGVKTEAPGAADATRDADSTTEAELHSIAETLNIVLKKIRR